MSGDVRALTVHQPWAVSLVLGAKPVENRRVLWSYRGPLLIHAGASWSFAGAGSPLVVRALERWTDPAYAGQRIESTRFPTVIAFRAIVGGVDLVDVHHAEPGCCGTPWAEQGDGVTHLVVTNAWRLLDPVSASGRQGLWCPHDDVVAQVADAERDTA